VPDAAGVSMKDCLSLTAWRSRLSWSQADPAPIDLSVPELPLQRLHVGVDISHFVFQRHASARHYRRSAAAAGSSCNVEPVNDMRRRLRQPFHDLGTIGENRDLGAARIPPSLCRACSVRDLKLALRCVGGREIGASCARRGRIVRQRSRSSWRLPPICASSSSGSANMR
jgi:hypothetical protein